MGVRQATFLDYDGFIEKFKPKKTTDDCYTPPAVYDAVLSYVDRHICPLEGHHIVRPFFPGGDYEGYGYSTAPKMTKATVLVKSASGNTAVAFMNVQFVVNYVDDDMSNPQRVHFIGTVLANTGDGEDFYILTKGVTE